MQNEKFVEKYNTIIQVCKKLIHSLHSWIFKIKHKIHHYKKPGMITYLSFLSLQKKKKSLIKTKLNNYTIKLRINIYIYDYKKCREIDRCVITTGNQVNRIREPRSLARL